MSKLQPPLAPLAWWPESADIERDPESGAQIRMCTSAAAITNDVYCEQPYCSADGNRLAMIRFTDPDPASPRHLMVYDINRYQVACLVRGIYGVANAAWSGVLFCTTSGEGDKARFIRVDLNTPTPTVTDLFPVGDIPGAGVSSVSGDSRWGLTAKNSAPDVFTVYKVDMTNGKYEKVHESPDICNPHLQWRLRNGSRILIQENRGAKIDFETGQMLRVCDPDRGVGLYSIKADGTDRKDFPVGPPHTPRTTGHECWIGDTDRVLVTTAEPAKIDGRTGGVFECSHDRAKARVVFETPYCWNHISATRCGRFFVTDCYQLPGIPILVGSIRTGKTRVITKCKTTGGGGQYSHAHPYITSENKHVVYNSDRTGLSQVYIATIPDGFLEELDSGPDAGSS